MFLFYQDSGTRQFFLTNLVEAEGGHYKWRVNLDSITRNFNNIATFPTIGTSCPVPTLFIVGANSDYVRSVYGSNVKLNSLAGIEISRNKHKDSYEYSSDFHQTA
jgi:hypothetical protein